ncbi:MAG: class I SAM-dependent methyltransferase [Nanoarchaeota archaeon]
MPGKKDVETFYDRISGDYADHDERVCDAILEHFIRTHLPAHQDLEILDAGGGTGRFALPLLRRNMRVVLTDISEGMLARAKERLDGMSAVSFLQESVTDMTHQKDGSFDAVLMMNAIHDYCGDYAKAISEAYRVLRKGGVFIGNVNNRFAYCTKHELKDGNYRRFEQNMKTGDRYIVWGNQDKGHISHEFTLDELKEALESFDEVKILGVFNLMDKYEHDSIVDKDAFIRLQIAFAEKSEYINCSQDFFFVAKKS